MNQSSLREQHFWKDNIKQWAMDLGFVAVGFTSAEPVEGLREFLEQRTAQGLATSFEAQDLSLRADPKAVWPQCETVVALAYPLPLSSSAKIGEGVLVRSAVGEDYHRLVQGKLELLNARMMEAGWPSLPPRVQVDTGPLVERAFAARAGVGWIGRNQQLIVPGAGSFVALALLLLDQELPPDNPVPDKCSECELCLKACPAQIIGKETFAANKCLSYLTQSKQVLDVDTRTKLGERIFGCDTCQEVCPHNRECIEQERELEQELEREESARASSPSGRGSLHRGVDLLETLNLTRGEFNRRFRPSAAGWRGKGIFQRNAYLALKQAQDPRLQEWLARQTEKGQIPSLILPYLDEGNGDKKSP
ncbi:tRNA epoxyqueuosine(34) reductase QueG [Paradesulfitobacterium aromaticivorans]